MMKHDLIFICCTIRVHENLSYMKQLKSCILIRKSISFCILDALLLYYYLILGLQVDTCLNYLEFYLKYYINPQNLLC